MSPQFQGGFWAGGFQAELKDCLALWFRHFDILLQGFGGFDG